MNSKAIKRQLLAAIAMVLVATLALGSSTYAWFVNNSQVTATGGEITAQTSQYLFIANGDQKFGTTILLDKVTELIPASTTSSNLSTGSFFIVDNTKADAWVDSHANRFVAATKVASTENDAYTNKAGVKLDKIKGLYHDVIELQANMTTDVTLDIAVSSETRNVAEAVYIAFVPRTGSTSTTAQNTVVYQLNKANTNSHNTGNTVGATTDQVDTNNATKQGIASVDGSGTATLGAITVTSKEYTASTTTLEGLTFNTLTLGSSATTAEATYDMYVWLEGTDPQCYNEIAEGGVKFDLTFKAAAMNSQGS